MICTIQIMLAGWDLYDTGLAQISSGWDLYDTTLAKKLQNNIQGSGGSEII